MTLLLSCTVGIAKDSEPPSMALFMKKPKPTTSCRKSSFRFGRKPVVIQQGRETTRLDGDYRAAACHRPVAAAAGLFPCARAVRRTRGPGITDSPPRRRRSTCVKRSPHVFEKKHSSLASFATRSRGTRFFQRAESQGNCCCYAGPSWNREDAVGIGLAEIDSRTQAIAA